MLEQYALLQANNVMMKLQSNLVNRPIRRSVI